MTAIVRSAKTHHLAARQPRLHELHRSPIETVHGTWIDGGVAPTRREVSRILAEFVHELVRSSASIVGLYR